MTDSTHSRLVRRFWKACWADDHDALLAELLDAEVTFRGSLGLTAVGRGGVSGYIRQVQQALPDFAAEIDELIHDGDKVVTRITFSGTHRGGALFEVPPTGNRVSYPAVAIHRFKDGRMEDVWVVGDTLNLARQLGEVNIRPGA